MAVALAQHMQSTAQHEGQLVGSPSVCILSCLLSVCLLLSTVSNWSLGGRKRGRECCPLPPPLGRYCSYRAFDRQSMLRALFRVAWE
jgi:hypothetical protein